MGPKFPTVVASWRRAWGKVIPFFAFPPEVRRIIYTTNAIESVNARLRKILKTRGHFSNDEAATKLIWLALRNITKDWSKEHLNNPSSFAAPPPSAQKSHHPSPIYVKPDANNPLLKRFPLVLARLGHLGAPSIN